MQIFDEEIISTDNTTISNFNRRSYISGEIVEVDPITGIETGNKLSGIDLYISNSSLIGDAFQSQLIIDKDLGLIGESGFDGLINIDRYNKFALSLNNKKLWGITDEYSATLPIPNNIYAKSDTYVMYKDNSETNECINLKETDSTGKYLYYTSGGISWEEFYKDIVIKMAKVPEGFSNNIKLYFKESNLFDIRNTIKDLYDGNETFSMIDKYDTDGSINNLNTEIVDIDNEVGDRYGLIDNIINLSSKFTSISDVKSDIYGIIALKNKSIGQYSDIENVEITVNNDPDDCVEVSEDAQFWKNSTFMTSNPNLPLYTEERLIDNKGLTLASNEVIYIPIRINAAKVQGYINKINNPAILKVNFKKQEI